MLIENGYATRLVRAEEPECVVFHPKMCDARGGRSAKSGVLHAYE